MSFHQHLASPTGLRPAFHPFTSSTSVNFAGSLFDKDEIVHDEVAADVTVLIAHRKDRQRPVAIRHRKVEHQVCALPRGRSHARAGGTIIEIHAERSNGANAGPYVATQGVIAGRQTDVLRAIINEPT